jgi:hypothetical protein
VKEIFLCCNNTKVLIIYKPLNKKIILTNKKKPFLNNLKIPLHLLEMIIALLLIIILRTKISLIFINIILHKSPNLNFYGLFKDKIVFKMESILLSMKPSDYLICKILDTLVSEIKTALTSKKILQKTK